MAERENVRERERERARGGAVVNEVQHSKEARQERCGGMGGTDTNGAPEQQSSMEVRGEARERNTATPV
jgi:hypothetical protein